MIIEVTKLIKHALKGKVKFSKSMVIMYMMTGLIMSSSIGVVQAETGVVVNTSANNNIIISTDGTVGQSTEASTNGKQDIIIGYDSKSIIASAGAGTNNTVIGVQSTVSNGINSAVIGYSAKVSGSNSTVVGNTITATGTQSTAFGSKVQTTGSQSTAIGNDAIASNYGAIVIGSDDAGVKNDSRNQEAGGNTLYATLRFDPVAKETISLSKSNEYKIARTTNFKKMVYENGTVVTPREPGTNYIYLTKYNTVTGKYEAIPEGDPSMPASYKWQAVKGSAANKLADADGNAGWDIFGLYKYYKDQNPSLSDKEIERTINNFFDNPYQEARSAGVGSIAIGIKTQALSDGAIAQGVAAYAGGHESIAIGVGTTTVEEKSVAIGSLAQASGKRTVAIGSYSNEIDYSKIRYNSPHAVADDAVAIGTASYADYEKAVALGAGAITTGDAGKLRATYDPNNLTNKFTLGETTTAGATGVVNSATVGNVTYGNFAGAAGKGLVSIGSANNEKRLQNVAAGEITATSTDAINGSQLFIATKSLEQSQPFEYGTINPDGTSNPVEQGVDGKYYTQGSINVPGVSYDPATGTYVNDGDGTTVNPVDEGDIVIRAKGNYPEMVTNVKSNLPEVNNGNAGGTTTGFGGNADGITKNGDVITGVAAPTDEQVKSIANNAASVGDVLNAGWNLQNNGTAKDYVKPYDTVNFIDGVGTKAIVKTADDGLSSTVTFDVDTSSLPGWTLTTSKSDGDVTGNTNEDIKPGEIVTIDAGKNIAITQAANKITIATKDEVTFKTVTSTDENGNKTVLGPTGTTTTDAAGNKNVSNATGNTITDTAGNKNVSNATGNTITDVAGNKNVSNATGNTITDAAGNTTNVTGDGITITGKKDDGTAKDSVSLTSNGLDNGNNKITNVAAGTDPTDAVNVSQLKDTVGEAVTNNPFEYTTKNGNPVTVGKDGNMYNPSDLADAKYDNNTKTYTKPDGTEVKPIDKQDVVINAKGDNPQTITNVKSNLPEANNGNAGGTTTGFGGNADGITKNGDAITSVTAPTEEQVKSMANNAASVGDVLNAGWNLQNNGTAKDYVKPYDTVNFIDGVGTKAVVKTADDGLSSTITFDVNTGSMSATDGMAVNNNASNIENANKELANAKDVLATVKADPNATPDAIAKAEKDVMNKQAIVDGYTNQVATVQDVVNTINNTYWTATSGQEGSGVVESTTKESVKAGDEVTFKAGNNLKLVQDGKNFTYSLQDSISLTEVKTGNTVMNTGGLQVGDSLGNITKIGSNGITIGGNDRQSVSLTNTGLDNGGNRIINVAPGVENTDAVNVGQLRESNIQMNQQVNKLSNDMKHMGAKAAALSSLRTIQYDPLEPTQISAGVGYYSGASAMALGISHYKNESTLFSGGIAFGGSDGGKIMANASVTWKLGHRADETAVSDTYRNGPISSTYALQDTVKALTAENKAQKSALQGQQQEIDLQRNKIEELEAKLAKIMSQLGV